MTGPTHTVVGIASVVAFGHATGIVPTPVNFILVVIGALAPDIDGEGTIARPGTILKRFIPKILRQILDWIGRTISSIIRKLFGHRGVTHWLIWPLLMMAAAPYSGHGWLFWFGLGYLSHILADSLTVAGTPLLAPIYRESIALARFRTGSKIEGLIFSALLLYVLCFGYIFLPKHTQEAFLSLWNLVTGAHHT